MRYTILFVLVFASTSANAQWQASDAQGNQIKTGPEYADNGEFGALQISTTDPEQLHKSWAQTTPGVDISTQKSATRNQPIFSFVIFRGCKARADGNCNVTTRFTIFDPNGKQYGSTSQAPVWHLPPPPLGNLQLGEAAAGLRIEDGELLGNYRVIAQTTDNVANITVATAQILTIDEAPPVGGWTAVTNPGDDAEIRSAAAAVIDLIPKKPAQLQRIEQAQRQIAAGTNLRLILRLVDGSKWGARVHHKLDGSYAVETPGEIQ